MDPRPTTHLSRAFCSARDRNVPVLLRTRTRTGSEAWRRSETELFSCLDYGVRCTGALCPLFSLPAFPSEGLLHEALEVERQRPRPSSADALAVLERALRETWDRTGREPVQSHPVEARTRRGPSEHGPHPPPAP